jgi:hypothetical protein
MKSIVFWRFLEQVKLPEEFIELSDHEYIRGKEYYI